MVLLRSANSDVDESNMEKHARGKDTGGNRREVQSGGRVRKHSGEARERGRYGRGEGGTLWPSPRGP